MTGYATDLMAGLQETLKASSGIDMKELIETYVGKDTFEKIQEEIRWNIIRLSEKEKRWD